MHTWYEVVAVVFEAGGIIEILFERNQTASIDSST